MDSAPYFALAVVAMASLWWGVPALYADLLRRSLRTAARAQQRVHLTFDDGPGRQLTPQVLDRLDTLGARATFFVLGCNIAGREALVREAAARGHIVGCHGFDHISYWGGWPGHAIRDIRKGWQAMAAVLDGDPRSRPFRPPFGRMSLPVLLYLRWHRTPIWMWTLDSQDTSRDRPPDGAATRAAVAAAGGGVILMHDHDRSQPERNAQLLRLLEDLVPLGAEWHLVPVDTDRDPRPAPIGASATATRTVPPTVGELADRRLAKREPAEREPV